MDEEFRAAAGNSGAAGDGQRIRTGIDQETAAGECERAGNRERGSGGGGHVEGVKGRAGR